MKIEVVTGAINLNSMNTNRFKISNGFSNIQKKLQYNNGYRTENYSHQIKDNSDKMRDNHFEAIKKTSGFSQKTIKEIWEEIEELASEEWAHRKMKKNNLIFKVINLTSEIE